MIISKKYALRLMKESKAGNVVELKPDDQGRIYVAIDRYDLQRIDHYEE